VGYGITDFTASDTPGASDFDGIMRQTTMAFASVAARDSAMSGKLAEGQRAYTEDANTFWWYTGAAWVIETEPEQSWTPTLGQGGTVSKTTNWGTYKRSNGRYWAECKLTVSGTGTATNIITVSTPITQVQCGGSFRFWDDSIGWYRVGNVEPNSTTELAFVIERGTALYGIHPNDGLTSGDVLWINVQGTY
jgi:hypothetical protein